MMVLNLERSPELRADGHMEKGQRREERAEESMCNKSSAGLSHGYIIGQPFGRNGQPHTKTE